MKRLVIIPILTIVCAIKSYSQVDTTKGIQFVHNLSWQEILQKARAENKYVFVDCYATWCGPCKWMDKEVYPVDSVGSFINERFIAVKIQMDTTGQDDVATRRWYETAHEIEQKYHIGVYPTYLFFAPDGHVVHKDLGLMGSNDFLSMAIVAMDSSRQYYTLLSHYRQGDKNYRLMPVLVDAAARLRQDSISKQVARDYEHNYLLMLPDNRRWTKENIVFVSGYSDAVNYQDIIFQSYYQNRNIIDSVMGDPKYADYLINAIVYRDLIETAIVNAIKSKSEPAWRRLEKYIVNRFNKKYVHNNMLRARIEYYRSAKKWNSYVKYFIRQEYQNGIETWTKGEMHQVFLNNAAYEIFQHSNSRQQLKIALSWVNRALAMDERRPYLDAMDTKANILYKLGRKEEGLSLEEQTHNLSPKDKAITATYEKMKNGLPTWLLD